MARVIYPQASVSDTAWTDVSLASLTTLDPNAFGTWTNATSSQVDYVKTLDGGMNPNGRDAAAYLSAVTIDVTADTVLRVACDIVTNDAHFNAIGVVVASSNSAWSAPEIGYFAGSSSAGVLRIGKNAGAFTDGTTDANVDRVEMAVLLGRENGFFGTAGASAFGIDQTDDEIKTIVVGEAAAAAATANRTTMYVGVFASVAGTGVGSGTITLGNLKYRIESRRA